MGKRKRSFSHNKDPANLKRFRSVIEKFVEDASAKEQSDSGPISSPGRSQVSGGRVSNRTDGRGREQGRNQNRKRRRQEERKLKKVKNMAFAQRKHIPSMAEYRKTTQNAAAVKRLEKREEKKKMSEHAEVKIKTVKKDNVQKQKEDSRKQGLVEANKQEERIIRQLEKQLKMKKRQSLPKAFTDDGLDYIFDALDSDKLYSTYGQYSDEDEADIPDRPQKKPSPDTADNESSADEGDEDELNNESDDDSDDEMLAGNVIDSDEDSATEKQSKNITVFLNDSRTSRSILKHHEEPVSLEKKNIKKAVSFGKIDETNFTNQRDDDDDTDDDSGDDDDNNEMVDDNDSEDDNNEEDETDDDNDNDNDVIDENSNMDNRELHRKAKAQPTLREDIYGRLRDEQGNIIPEEKTSGTYIPPGKRLKLAEGEDSKRVQKLERLKKQLKGLVNRVSEANIQPISTQIEEIYRTNSRADVSESLCNIVMEACISPVMTPERLVMELTMLIAILHGNVGPECGACFIQNLAKHFKTLQMRDDSSEEGKEMENVISLFAHLYNFKVIHCGLIFDILKTFTESFEEKDIELILHLLKNVGFTLRKDDPAALKQIIIEIQSKANTVDTSHFVEKSRVKFMLETMLAIRNNNMRKIPNYDPSHLEHLRKLIRNYVRGGKLTDNQLRISLSDLSRAEETGRWWLVGSAWSGGLTDGQADTAPEKMDNMRGSVLSSSSVILESARTQRMNTETRKTIFCTIMGSEDFVDAFEKLLKPGLKHKQEREIVYVIVDCCGQEKTFNPFYAYLLQKFCEYDRRFQMTFQFHLWDKFALLSQLSEQNLTNLGRLLTHLIASKAISLSVLKTVEFGTLEKPMVRFLKLVLQGILLDYPDHVTSDIFSRIAPLSKLHLLHEGLKLFMHHFLLKSKKSKKSLDSDSVLPERIRLAEKSLAGGQSDMLL